MMLYPKEHRVWDGEPEGVSEWFQTGFRPFGGALTGCALFPEKKLNLNTAVLENKSPQMN